MISKNTRKMKNNLENLKSIASEHLFMHGVQINDWKNEGPMIFVEGEGSWVTDIEGKKYLDMMYLLKNKLIFK